MNNGFNNYNMPAVPQDNMPLSNMPFYHGTDTSNQQAVVYIDLAKLMQTYVNGCKEMFQLGVISGEMSRGKKDSIKPGNIDDKSIWDNNGR